MTRISRLQQASPAPTRRRAGGSEPTARLSLRQLLAVAGLVCMGLMVAMVMSTTADMPSGATAQQRQVPAVSLLRGGGLTRFAAEGTSAPLEATASEAGAADTVVDEASAARAGAVVQGVPEAEAAAEPMTEPSLPPVTEPALPAVTDTPAVTEAALPPVTEPAVTEAALPPVTDPAAPTVPHPTAQDDAEPLLTAMADPDALLPTVSRLQPHARFAAVPDFAAKLGLGKLHLGDKMWWEELDDSPLFRPSAVEFSYAGVNSGNVLETSPVRVCTLVLRRHAFVARSQSVPSHSVCPSQCSAASASQC